MSIFISHNNKDDNFVDQLRINLQRRGYITWVDHRDITAGKKWEPGIDTKLKECDVMIVVLSN